MLRKLYDGVLRLSASRHATSGLATVSFAESSFFPIPPDVMLAPMVMARPDRAWFYAAVCTLASVAGGMLGYAIGYFLEDFGLWLLNLMGQSGGLKEFQCWYQQWGVWVILAKGLTPIPYKLVTIASGLAEFNFGMFMIASVITRGARFFAVAGLIKKFGPSIMPVVEKRLTLFTVLLFGVIILALVGSHFIGGDSAGAASACGA